MPTYRYECDRCEAIHEVFQSMAEKPRTQCPDCGGGLTRLIGGGGGVILKGSGFYTTDYRSDSYKSAARKDSEPARKHTDVTKDKPKKSEAKKSGGGTGGKPGG